MADKKLNEVTQVSSDTLNNVKSFLAVMNDGSIQQMTKADMASVLEGLIGTATDSKNGLLNKDFIFKNIPFLPIVLNTGGVVSNLNTIFTELNAGAIILEVNSISQNIPSGVTMGYCIHLQRASKGNVTGGQIITQILFSRNKTYRRYGIGNGSAIDWSDWELV